MYKSKAYNRDLSLTLPCPNCSILNSSLPFHHHLHRLCASRICSCLRMDPVLLLVGVPGRKYLCLVDWLLWLSRLIPRARLVQHTAFLVSKTSACSRDKSCTSPSTTGCGCAIVNVEERSSATNVLSSNFMLEFNYPSMAIKFPQIESMCSYVLSQVTEICCDVVERRCNLLSDPIRSDWYLFQPRKKGMEGHRSLNHFQIPIRLTSGLSDINLSNTPY